MLAKYGISRDTPANDVDAGTACRDSAQEFLEGSEQSFESGLLRVNNKYSESQKVFILNSGRYSHA
jgi:hypothetical protein